MNYDLNEVIGKLTDFLKTEAKTETVVGEQFQLGDYKCVPVMGIGIGLGFGGGEGNSPKEASGNGLGGGAGMGMGPIGFLVSKGTDIQFIPTRQSKGLGTLLEKMPDLLSKFMDKKKEAS